MKTCYRIVFLILHLFPLFTLSAQSICTPDSRYQEGGFSLSSTDICHNEAVTITNTAGVENPVYYYNYRGESYEEVLALGGATLDFSTVTKPGVYQVIQVGKKDGKETVKCQEVKVRNSTTPVFSYTFCTGPTRIEVLIPSHPLNDYTSYQIELNGTAYPGMNTNVSYPFPVQNVQNTLKVTGIGGSKTCSSDPLPTIVQPFNNNGRDYEYYPEIKELKVLDDKRIRIDFQGQYEQTYNFFRYPNLGTPSPPPGLLPIQTAKPGTLVIDTPPDTDQVYCYYIQPNTPANCGAFSNLRSAYICSVPLKSPVSSTPETNYLEWKAYTASATDPLRFKGMEVIRVSDGASEVLASVDKDRRTYQDDHKDCSKKFCYRIRVTYAGVNNGANYSGTSLSNQLCFDHRLELTDFPPNTFVTTKDQKNLVSFEGSKDSPFNFDRWELHKFDGTAFTLLETLNPGAFPLVIEDKSPGPQSEKYKVRYVDECENFSAFSPEVSSLFLDQHGDNVLDWTSASPFDGSDITQYEVIYYEGDNLNNPLTTRRVDASTHSHTISASSFTNLGTFVVKAVSSDGRESFSNPVTFTIKGSLYLPTAFSPNGDQHNETFTVKGSLGGIKTFHMEIFSASGQKIADITDPVKGWDGKLPNGDPAIFGNYLYILKAEMANGQMLNKNGSFVLLY